MSEFSEYCRHLLANSGSNVYQIANHSSLDRTSIQRMIRGERLPSRKFVKDFCSYLRINPIQQEEVLKLYDIEKIGKTEYLKRCYIKDLIERLSFLENDNSNTLSGSEDFSNAFSVTPCVENKIFFTLQKELETNTNPEILLNVPTSYRYVFFVLKKLFSQFSGHADIKHLITLNSNPSNSLHPCQNLEIMSDVLPTIQLLKDVYHPSYLYSNITSDDEKLMVMPYYIITSQNVLIISSDFKSAVLYHSWDIVKEYRDEFYRIFQMAKPFMEYANNPICIMKALEKIYVNFGLPSHTLEFHPCLFFMNVHFNSEKDSFSELPNAAEYIDALQKMYKVVAASTPPLKKMKNTVSFFSEEGLNMFCQTGKCFGQYKNLKTGFSAIERKSMMQNYFHHKKEGDFTPHILKPEFKLPTYLNIELHDIHTLTIFIIKENFQFSFIQINESSLCNAFYSFFEYLASSDFVYTKKEEDIIFQNAFSSIS